MTAETSQSFIETFPNGMIPLESQVAGHTFEPGTNSVGLLKSLHDATVLKPLGKPQCAVKEVGFYECVKNGTGSDIELLRKLIPQYFGTIKFRINGREMNFIKLEDLTVGIHKPCIMDIKIGKRTWDPLASAAKQVTEEEKYSSCKKNVGLCIPGFQVYNLFTDKLERFGKDYGKALNENTLKDALKLFLNGTSGLCRPLILQILHQLWPIQKWSRIQTFTKLYASSILIVYDAKRLKSYLTDSGNKFNNFNGSIPFQMDHTDNCSSSTVDSKLCCNKISTNNKIRNNMVNGENGTIYDNTVFTQNNISGEDGDNTTWVRVKMIDFAHAFLSNDDDNTIDTNYLFGIENLVKIFEGFLKECTISA